ncbi:MAG: glycosyltransferase [Candidatus Nanopelagicales bacterium]
MSTRVVIAVNTLDEVGGAQRVAHVVADGLARRGYRVDLVGIAPHLPRHEYPLDSRVRRVTLMSQEWPPPPRGLGFRARHGRATRQRVATRSLLRAEAVAGLAALLADGPPGVVVSTQLWAMEHLVEVPHDDWAVVGQYHSSFEAAAAGRDLARAVGLYADVDSATLLTPADAEAFRRAGLNNTSWLANPLAFWPQEPVPVRRGDQGTVMYLGRLAVEKGTGFCLSAWGRVAAEFPGWTLRLAGSGPDEKALRKQAAGLPSGADRVEFCPPVADAEGLLREADLFVLPSLTEGLPLALAEAMASGLACIATDCSAGVRLLGRDGAAARLVPRADPTALAEQMAALMGSADDRAALGRQAREAVLPYRADLVLDQWEALLARVLR